MFVCCVEKNRLWGGGWGQERGTLHRKLNVERFGLDRGLYGVFGKVVQVYGAATVYGRLWEQSDLNENTATPA